MFLEGFIDKLTYRKNDKFDMYKIFLVVYSGLARLYSGLLMAYSTLQYNLPGWIPH